MTLSIDHIVVCVEDLDHTAGWYRRQHGLTAVDGGRHAGHGTANRLIPLGSAYIELVAVVDRAEAESSQFGSWVSKRGLSETADAICLRTEDLDVTCERLGLEAVSMSRQTPDGHVLNWRLAGLAHTIERGWPFFIEWDIPPELHPGLIDVRHPSGRTELGQVIVSGDVAELSDWAGTVPGLSYQPGEAGVSFSLVSP